MRIYIIISVVVHVAAIALLSLNMAATPKPPKQNKPQGQPIKAVAVNQSAVAEQVEKLKQAKEDKRLAEKKRLEDLERKLKEAENKRKAEESRLRKLEAERKQKIEEKKKADAAAKKAKQQQKVEAEKARKAEAERKKREAEKKKADEAAAAKKRKEEAERKRKEEARKRKEQEAREQAELERMMEDELNAENQKIGEQRQAQILSEMDKYTALIRATVQRHWLVDDSMAGQQCQLNIKLASNGFVISVDNGVGNRLVCSSARNAVLKAGTMPMSADPEVNQKMRNIKLTMEPNL
ncbi:cell envelope integrity protein TolA [Echinimonas agarilytica]|uniref:Cell envelope integrity protein TolA n=1 Tax=Echinimonas agarilytica TaxID=1215918 RepID=A0AA41W7E7_9GAMM|nr:cell envelope integrity protein TolA [Echinimonas agarilytica]MCM2679698.1 cell envelope integrity protein TolA [Echinimonas agarilytica]